MGTINLHVVLTIDHSNSRSIDGFDLGYFVPSWCSHYQIPRQHFIKCSRQTSVRSNQYPPPPSHSRRSRRIPRKWSPIFHLSYLPSTHVKSNLLDHFFGAAIIGMAIVQAFFGWYHHNRYVRDKPSKRRWFTHVHLWLGRVTILSGLANCGFGIIAAGEPTKYAFIFWIGSGILATLYFGAYIIHAFIQRRRGGVKYSPATPGPYELDPYQGSRVNLVSQPGPPEASVYSAPPPGTIPGRYEPDRYDDRFQERDPEPYDPPRRQFDEPVQRYGSPIPRYGSPSRQDLHLGP